MPGTLILHIETATTICSVALAENGRLLELKEAGQPNIHAEAITVFIDEVMTRAGKAYRDLDAIAVSRGPGSYTGLRIGVSAAKGLCYALDIPLIAVDTLYAMAAGFAEKSPKPAGNGLLCPMIDARRMEVYSAVFTGSLETVEPVAARILDENSFSSFPGPVHIFGDGASKAAGLYADDSRIVFHQLENSAAWLIGPALEKLKAADFEDTAYFEPFYLKDFMIRPPKSQNSG